MNTRRWFLGAAAVGGAAAALGAWRFYAGRAGASPDVVVLGGGLGGCAAALAACRAGLRVVLTEETAWLGGQATQQAVPPDENKWVESFGATATYREWRNRIRDLYRGRQDRPLTAAAKANPLLNPGNGWVSRLCFEPQVGVAALDAMLAPHAAAGRLLMLLHTRATAADTDGDRVRAVTVRDLRSGADRVLTAPYFLDATEQGDLLALAGVEFVTGSEARKDTGEPHAGETARPSNIQSFTCCYAIDYVQGEEHVIDKPAEYDFWRAYAPELRPPYNGKLFSWDHPSKKGESYGFDPLRYKTDEGPNFWTYRRIIDRGQFAPGAYPGDVTIVNWHQNDYYLGPLLTVSDAEAAKNLARAKQLSLSLLYWLQTESPRPGGKPGWPGLRLRKDVVGTDDGLAMYPYIRESRRIKAEFTVAEQHVVEELRRQETGKDGDDLTAAPFADSVGVGHYPMDLHPSTGGDNGLGYATLPFQIPCGALIPVRCENVLPACKNLGVTHLTNGCYRLHPVEWNVGEAAGALAALCVQTGAAPRQVRNTAGRLAELQKRLTDLGIPLAWPADLKR